MCESICTHRAATKKNMKDGLIFCKKYRDWAAEDCGKVIFFDKSPVQLFEASAKKSV